MIVWLTPVEARPERPDRGAEGCRRDCDLSRDERVGMEFSREMSPLARASGITQKKELFGSVLSEDALQRAPMHLEAAGGFRNVAVAYFVNALDMLPAHTIGGHRIFRRLDLFVVDGEQGRSDIIGVDRLGEIIHRAKLHRVHRGSDIALAGEDDGTGFGPTLLNARYNVKTVAIAKAHVDDGKSWRGCIHLQQPGALPWRRRDAQGAPCRRRRSEAIDRSQESLVRRSWHFTPLTAKSHGLQKNISCKPQDRDNQTAIS